MVAVWVGKIFWGSGGKKVWSGVKIFYLRLGWQNILGEWWQKSLEWGQIFLFE